MRDRPRIVLLVSIAILLAAGMTASVVWYERPTTLTIAVGPGPERAFAGKLAALLTQNHSSVRLSVVDVDSPAQATAAFLHRKTDLAILRSDVKPPPQARAIAVLESDLLLIIGKRATRIRTMADLKGRRLAVLGVDGRNEALVRKILRQYDIDAARTHTQIQTYPLSSAIDQLLGPGGNDIVISFTPFSWIAETSAFEDLSHRMGGFSLLDVNEAKALERKMPGLTADTIEAGLLSGNPRIPDDEISTMSLQVVLVARSKVSDQAVVTLMRPLFENKADLAVDKSFATKIGPPDLEKDALFAVHNGALEYLESDEKSFFDRYSDAIYLTMSAGSVAGSLGLALFTSVFRVRPRKASESAAGIMAAVEKIHAAESATDIDAAEAEIETVLSGVLRGLMNGTVSPDGLEVFRLAHEHARDTLAEKKRNAPDRLSDPPSPS